MERMAALLTVVVLLSGCERGAPVTAQVEQERAQFVATHTRLCTESGGVPVPTQWGGLECRFGK